MALAAAEGPISIVAERLQTMLEACSAWTALSGTIHHNHLPEPTNKVAHTLAEIVALRPFALIWTEDGGYSVKRTTPGGGGCHEASGRLLIRIERNQPAGETPAESDRSWENTLGMIITGTTANPGLIRLASDPSYIAISRIRMIDHASTDPKKVKDIGKAQRAFLSIEWGTT